MRFPTWKEVESDPEFQSLDTAKKKDYFGKWSRTAVDRAMQQGLYRDEEFASGFTGWYNQKAKEYGDEEEFADFGQLSKRKLKPEVGVFEGIANAAQNAFASSQQAIKTVGGVTPEEAKEISKLEFEKKAREVSPDYKAYQDAEGMDAVKAFITNPFEVTTNIVAEGLSGSLPALGTGLAAGAVGAAIGAPTGIGAPVGFLGGQVAGTFAGSLATEYGSKMLEELQNAGMDINNPDSITEFFSNQKLVDEAKDKALKRGVPVAAFDALSAGIGGKVAKITKAAFKTPVREVAAETAIQAALGGGGEVAGSLAAGEEIRPKDVFAEIVGEVGPGAAEIAIGKVQQGFAERRKQRQLQEAAKVASNLENNNAPLTAQAVTVTSAKDALQQEKQTNEQTETELAQEREKFAPKTTVYEVPAKEEFKTTFAQMSPESLTQTEQGFREELESEDADTRAFAQAGLDALAEFRAGVAPTPITVPPVEEVAPAVAAVTQPAAPDAPITPAAPEELAAPQRTIAESIRDKDTFVFNGMRGAISVEDGVTVFRPFATAEKYEVPVNPNQPISEIEGVEWVRKGQTRQAPAEPALPQVASVIESKPQVTEEEIAATEDDFEIPQALIEIENSPTLNAIADIFDVGESKLVKEVKRSVKISSTPEFYTQISPEQIEVANRQIDTALRVIDRLPISEEQKQALAEPYLLIDQDITNYESNPKYQQYKSSLRREVRPSGEAVAFPETISEVESGVQELERRERAAQPAAVAPQPVAAEPITSADAQVINNLRSVAENTANREQISALSAAGLVDIIKGQPVINQDGEAILSRAQAPLPRLTPAERVAEIQAAPAPAPAPVAPAVTTPPAPEAVTPASEGIAVGNRIKLGKSPQTYVVEEVIPQTATERDLGEQYYSVKNERTGEVQVVEKNDVKPVKAKGARKVAADIRETREEVTPAQEENRYTYEQILVAAKKFFGGKAPANLTIVNDSTDPDYRFKAGYNLETGQIILNQAYLSKEDNIADNIAHELGHFVYGDLEVQAAFKEFWNALSPEQQAQADDIIRRHYSEESQSVQMEENQVRAFGTLIAENRIAPKWTRFVEAVKAVLNRLIGTKFRLTDRGAQAVLSSAIKRFQSGERIIREMDAGTLRMAAEPEAAVEAEPTVEPAAKAPQKKPRPTTIQRLIEATTGVKRRRDLLTINEKTALKDQLKLGAKKRRLDAAQQKEFVKDLTAQLREEAIRGRVKAPQLRAIVNKAMQVRFDNDASILSFLNYANKVIDNANYDRDLSDAKKAIKSAKRLAKQKDVPAPAQGILKRFANINPSDIDNPSDFALVLNEYMKGYGPVTAEDYVVVPDIEMEAYLDDPEIGLLKQSEDAKTERDQMALINSLNAELGKEGLTEEEKNDILNMSEEDFSKMIQQRKADTQNEKRVARAEAIEKAINDIAANSQIALVNYQNPEMTADQKRILDLVKQVELDQLDVGSRKEYIRIANSILVNNGFFGSQKFASKVLGQLGAKEAAKDSKQTKRYNAMFKFLEGMIGERISKSINLSVQSIADTFRNIAGKDGAPKLLVQMGMGELAKGQATANKMTAEISDAIRGIFEKIEKETGLKISERRGSFAMGVAGNLLQVDPSETEAQGIQRIRNLIEQDIAIKEKSPSREDRESAVFVKRALDEVYADSVEGILANLKAAHPAHYEALIFLKDEILPEYKPLLKEHDELFNNQTDNYENVNYLPIRYRSIDFEIKAPEDLIQRQFRDVTEPKQSPNTIKRKKLTTLPPGRVFDYNLTRNVINALSDQITAANTNPAWQQIISFLASPDAAEAVGGVENLDFIKQRLGGLARARARTYATTGAERIADAFANLTRRFGIGLALGGYGQFFKQFPSQTATTLANVRDAGLLAESTRDLLEGKAQGIISQFSIGERGEIAGGTKWINQMEGNFGKVRKFYEEGRWAEFSDAFERLNNMWLFALKKSDYLAAGAGWLAYYRKHLKDKGIEFTGWENETNLINQNDPSRMEAAVYAEQMIDMYQGSSDPTKMAELSQRGQNGYENLFKAIFMPFFSFVLQERSRILSDTRDIAFGDANQKAQGAAGMGGTIAGMLIFHTMRRFLLPAVAAGGASAIYALLGVDMDEPDEEKQQEEANKIWRRFSAEVFSNIVVGGFGSLAENRFVDAVNYSFYLIESQIENENVLDDKGEVMSFDKYQKERSPFYRYTGMGADASFGMLDIMPGQISELRKRLEELSSEELAETLTPEERRVLYVAGFSELIYTMRLNDTDVARMIRQMNKDVIEQGKEREKVEKRLQNLYR